MIAHKLKHNPPPSPRRSQTLCINIECVILPYNGHKPAVIIYVSVHVDNAQLIDWVDVLHPVMHKVNGYHVHQVNATCSYFT